MEEQVAESTILDVLMTHVTKFEDFKIATSYIEPVFGQDKVDSDTIAAGFNVIDTAWKGAHEFLKEELSYANGVFRDVVGTIVGTVGDILEIVAEASARLLEVAVGALGEVLDVVGGFISKNPILWIVGAGVLAFFVLKNSGGKSSSDGAKVEVSTGETGRSDGVKENVA